MPKGKPYQDKEDFSTPFGDAAKFVDKNTLLTIVDANGKPLDITAVDYHMGGGGVVVTVRQKRVPKNSRPLERYVVQYGQYAGDKGYVVVASNAPLNKTRKVWFTSDNKGEAFAEAQRMNAAEEE